MYLKTLGFSAVIRAPCTRCIGGWKVVAGVHSVGHRSLHRRWLHNFRVGRRTKEISTVVCSGGRRSAPTKVDVSASPRYCKFSLSHHLRGLSFSLLTRKYKLSRDVSLEQTVKFSRQGCCGAGQLPKQHSTLSPAAASSVTAAGSASDTGNSRELVDQNNGQEKDDPRRDAWELPQGLDTGIKIFNSLTRKKEPLILPKGRLATWYTCGPTVYDHAHIGHASSYVRTDIIRRILINHFNIDVVMVMGVTDIDDKIIKRVKTTGVSHRHLTRSYEEEFFKDMDAMNIMPPTVKTRVTEHIPQIIFFITKLINRGFAYKTPSGTVYFDVQQYGRYGRLWTHSLDTQIRDSLDKDKRGPRDFALWKAAKPDEPSWKSPWGDGRPGWHIECSSMASSIFGEKLDIHSGGDDLRFPHHENEMAQSEACFCSNQWTNYWIHTGHLHLKNEKTKMSKSLNNTIRISELLKTMTSSQFRVFCMLRPYRQQIEYGSESMLKAIRIHDTFFSFMSLASAYLRGQVNAKAINEPLLMESLLETKSKVERALADDFDTPRAIGAIEELIRKSNTELGRKGGPDEPFVSRSPGTVASILGYIERMMDVWGVQPTANKLSTASTNDLRFENVVDSVIQFRSKIRQYALHPQEHLSQDEVNLEERSDLSSKERKTLAFRKVKPLLDACDELRDDLKLGGVTILDHGKTARWTVEQKKLPSDPKK